MSPDDECIHGLGPVAACTICNGREAKAAKVAATVVHRWLARYTSRLDCGHWVAEKDRIARLGNGDIVCEDCTP